MKLFARKPSAASEIDPSWGDEEARKLRDQLGRGKWQEAHSALEATSGSWDDRQFLVEVLTDDVPGRPKWIDEWTQAHPSSSVAWTVRGAHGIKWVYRLATDWRACARPWTGTLATIPAKEVPVWH